MAENKAQDVEIQADKAGKVTFNNDVIATIAALATVDVPGAVSYTHLMAIAITYKMAAAVIEPFGEKRLTSCLSGLSHVFTLLYIAVLAAGAMMFILTTLMIRAGNINVMMR